MSKTKRLDLRLTVEQYENLKRLAKGAKVSMAEWLLSSSELDSIGTLDDAPELLKQLDEIVRTREESEKIVRTNKNVATNPVRTNVPTKPDVRTVAKDAPIRTIEKELNKQSAGTTIETYGENEHTIEDVPTHTCTICKAPIKKGFLCDDCLK